MLKSDKLMQYGTFEVAKLLKFTSGQIKYGGRLQIFNI